MIKLSEMSDEALKSLYHNNEFLQKEAKEYSQEEFDFRMEEIMGYFRKIRGMEWNLGYPGNYISVEESAYKSFFDACLNLTHDMGFFTEETTALIERAGKKAEFFYDAMVGYEDISDSRFNCLENWQKKIVKSASDEIIENYMSEWNYYFSDEAAEECFFDIWIDSYGDDYLTDGEYVYEAELRKYS